MTKGQGLREVEWPRHLQGPDPELLERLYVPGLARAVRYDRCCAYFSSTVLAAAARGYAGLIERLLASPPDGPVVRLLVNEQLDQEDVEALLAHHDTAPLEKRLLRGLITPAEALARERLGMLAWLAQRGWLEMRVAVMRQAGAGILHAKFGVLTDAQGDQLAFFGSGNETGAALSANYELLQLFTSWQEPTDVAFYADKFERIWAGEDPLLCTVPLPEAVLLKLIRFASAEPPTHEPQDLRTPRAAMLWRYIAAAPYLPKGELCCDATAPVDPWPHQRAVVAETAQAFPAGRLLCDEVGMGKTIEALLVLRRLLAGRGVRRALLLVPAGLLRQWQAELREKGGLIVPYWEQGKLYWPNGVETRDVSAVLADQPLLLLSREWARLPANRDRVLAAPRYDLVLMDEAHAARRREQQEGEFNQGNLLLELLRQMQLLGKARGILLLSATPMQTQPWEPWDLLGVLGVGGRWMMGFDRVRGYYAAVAQLAQGRGVSQPTAQEVMELVTSDPRFPSLQASDGRPGQIDLRRRLTFPHGQEEAVETAYLLRHGAPLGRRMHRNTRETLRGYHRQGLLLQPPPKRDVQDVVFDYADARERSVYDAIKTYIDRRFEQLEHEKGGKGFVMTIYRRRMASSPYALRTSLERRIRKLDQVVRALTPALSAVNEEDESIADRLELEPDLEVLLDDALPHDPETARAEAGEIEPLLRQLKALDQTDSKRDRFYDVLTEALRGGRRVLVFTEYADTMRYLRDWLRPVCGQGVACYSSAGGEIYEGAAWVTVPKAEITRRLGAGQLDVVVCTDAASEGLNLQAASVVINYDLPWNPSRVEQRIGRVDRIGQVQQWVWVRNLFLENSVDMRVYALLRTRCGLFEHFVGYMQPVLDRARRALIDPRSEGTLPQLLAELDKLAKQQEGDAVSVNTFVSAEATATPREAPALTPDVLVRAMEMLQDLEGKVRVKPDVAHAGWWLYGLGRKRRLLAIDSVALEACPAAEPLTVLETARELAEALPQPSLVPLVIASAEAGAYRCCEARWVGEEAIVPVETATQLEELLTTWQGQRPHLMLLQQAQQEAEAAARMRLQTLAVRAATEERYGLEQQLDAARRRLRRELARTLACLDGAGDLNGTLAQQLTRENSTSGRYHQAVQLLGGKPSWERQEIEDAQRFADELPADARRTRLLGSPLQAALNDPRWQAQEGLKRVGE